MGKRRFRLTRLGPFALHLAKHFLKSRLLLAFLLLFLAGFWVGMRTRPDPSTVPYRELFESMNVLSYRDAPTDSATRFMVELKAGGRVFTQYDLDAHVFLRPERGRRYHREVSGTHYGPLVLRGHADRGFWLELPDSANRPILGPQFDELYRRSLEYVKPLSIATTVLGTLTGYSIGFRFATWSTSLSNPQVQDRVVETPGIGRTIAREAWRRVLLEPALLADESDAHAFQRMYNVQRIYARFTRLALADSDGFIPREIARLDSAGRHGDARLMRSFVDAVRRAAADSVALGSPDFRAVENWASLLDVRGHWANGLKLRPGEERMRYFGELAWYGLAPVSDEDRRVWVGPRVLVREGDDEGFIVDELAGSELACPVVWRERMHDEQGVAGMSTWTADWTGGRPEFAPVVAIGRALTRKIHFAH